MEPEPTEAPGSLLPPVSSLSWEAEGEEADPAPPSTSPAAREVEEELIVPTSTSPGSDEETVLPRSSSPEGADDTPDTSLPPSSSSPEPQGPSLSAPSSSGLGSCPFACASPALSTSPPPPPPLSWTAPSDGLRPEEAEGGGAPGERTKARKKGPGYSIRSIEPASQEELVSVAKAMHREKFARNTRELFHLEKEAALRSIQTGLYIGWRCPEYLWDCFRVGEESKCFCGHLLKLHQVYVERRARVPCMAEGCRCQGFVFVPSRPEEVGEFWLRRRTGFNATAWRAKCRCTHTHEEHTPIGARGCCVRGPRRFLQKDDKKA